MKVLMGEAEIAMIRGHLQPSHVMLEWGAGGSTVYFPQFVAAYFSVEHDADWFRRVTVELERQPAADVKLYHVPVKFGAASGREMYHDYIHFPRTLGRKFDRVLVDGRERVACAEVACELIAEGGVLFVHDYLLRPRYAAIAENWRMIDSIGRGQTLGVFQRKDDSRWA